MHTSYFCIFVEKRTLYQLLGLLIYFFSSVLGETGYLLYRKGKDNKVERF